MDALARSEQDLGMSGNQELPADSYIRWFRI